MKRPISSSPAVPPPLTLDKEQKTSFDKNGTRFYYYGQIEHDEFEKGKLAEFDKYLFENKLDVNRDFWNQQKILQFLSGNGYREKETYEAMQEHEKFRVEYLGTNNEKVQIEPIRDLIVRIMLMLGERHVLPLW